MLLGQAQVHRQVQERIHLAVFDTEILGQDFSVENGQMNPFLHLSMHLSLAEQHSIDQPPGVKSALDQLTQQTGSLHEAMHLAMDCLGEMLWQAQRNQTQPDPLEYLQCLQRKGH